MFEQTFKNIDDILRKEDGCSSELDYTEQSSWLLFLKYLDALERDKAMEAALEGKTYSRLIDAAYGWEAWAAPKTAIVISCWSARSPRSRATSRSSRSTRSSRRSAPPKTPSR